VRLDLSSEYYLKYLLAVMLSNYVTFLYITKNLVK